ncbi:DUF899 domain-containing protein [Actinacidiphila yeochonensis]|uniref:DUF899 domain-containing protein n=1 Tax=Actinacidiphila yeochonensis TaxID=89050 RepID=UPI00055DD045|nr:DUF899 domain-containing protein [Actinacidiphila yeochonensis]
MSLPEIVSQEQWLVARKELLAKEKELRRAQDALAAQRRRLPMVRMEKPYVFEGADGPVGLLELFEEKRQLIVQHVMFDPSWDVACKSCTAGIDQLAEKLQDHLGSRDTRYVLVARAPYPKFAAYVEQRGWTLPCFSSYGSEFNYDFNVSIDASVKPVYFNYRELPELKEAGLGWIADKPGEQPGLSCFLRDGDEVFHTYSTYARGSDFGGTYGFLDLTALGRQEEWEEPKGRAVHAGAAIPQFE